jgi:DNA-binding NtrC family response regulator
MKKSRPLRIMIVEDEPDLLSLYKEVLPSDWIIDSFDNARSAAHQYTADSNYDLVITDLRMNQKHGEGLIYDIKYINPAQRIIVLSGHTGDLNLRSFFQVKVFQKPWDIRNVIAILNKWDEDTKASDDR